VNNALSPVLFLRRNFVRVLPIALVIVIAVTLVSSVVTIIRSIDLTVFTLYGYNRFCTGLIPRNALALDPAEVARLQRLPELGRLAPTHSYTVRVKTIFGKMVFPIFGLSLEDRTEFLARCSIRLSRGHLPVEGQPEAVISEEVAQNLGLKLGDSILDPASEDNYAPVPVKLVGLLHGSRWLGLTSRTFVDDNSPFTWTGYIAFAPTRDIAAQERLDSAVERTVDKADARVWRYSSLVQETQSALANLYLILNLVVTIIVISVAFVCGLLFNIYFTQRLPEIATLSAIGYPRSLLIRRALVETAILCFFGWLLGGLLTVGLLETMKLVLFVPRGLLLNPLDPASFVFTLPLPFTITLVAVVTIGWRLARLDPVTIIERRG
jgi:ABC-type lipoprotein release transport system permease subunit